MQIRRANLHHQWGLLRWNVVQRAHRVHRGNLPSDRCLKRRGNVRRLRTGLRGFVSMLQRRTVHQRDLRCPFTPDQLSNPSDPIARGRRA